MERITWFKELYKVFDQIASHREEYQWHSDSLGTNIIIYPGVFSPKFFRDSEWYASQIGELVRGKSFLEVGSGTGLAVVWAGLSGASTVAATDINPEDEIKRLEKEIAEKPKEDVTKKESAEGQPEKSQKPV